MQRRNFIQALLAALAGTSAGARRASAFARPKPVFRHGVASGDPTDQSVILWTRITTASFSEIEIRWQLATDARFREIVTQGSTMTGPERDFTVKVDADGLDAGADYFYRFSADGQRSTVGKTKTLPTGSVGMARFAVVSCSNFPAGFFNVYDDISRRDDVDLVLHLGDYIYEYGTGEYATENAEAIGRIPDPRHEIYTLADYRRRHSQYKADVDSQSMHAAFPVVAIWDDHEFANDTWRDGAQNHQAGEGSWTSRRDAALQAWFEWMPVRGTAKGAATQSYRAFRWGDLANIVMLDTRLAGRDAQPNAGDNVTTESIIAALKDPARRMLGAEQEEWFRGVLQQDRAATWQLVGQQVMVGRMEPPDLEPLVDTSVPSYFPPETLENVIAASKSHAPQVLDVWDGYPLAREDFLRDLHQFADNPVVLSGDLHTLLGGNLVPAGSDRPVAVELMTGAVSSPTLSTVFPDKTPNGVRDATLRQNPNLRFLDIAHRGWLAVTLTPTECTGEWRILDTVLTRDYQSEVIATLAVKAGEIGKGLV